MIKCKSKYYRVHLKTAKEKAVYDTILTALENRQLEVMLETSLLATLNHSLDNIVVYVQMDNPGLFYVDFQQYHYLNSSKYRKIVFSYLYPIEQIDNVERQIQEKINSIIDGFKTLSPLEKEFALHDWLVANVSYEYKDMDYHKAHSAVGAILHGRAVCEGYSMAFKLLCDAVGISNIVVYGMATNTEGKTENHAWNIIKIDRKCYHVDATWDSCARGENMKCHSCLNITDNDIAQDHIWNKGMIPKCENTEDNYFVANGLFFKNRESLKKYLSENLKKGQKTFEVKVEQRYNDHSEILTVLQEAMRSTLRIWLFGSSSQIRYDAKRHTAQLQIN